MTIRAATTVGELAATLPGATRVFERFGIDYCCGGGQSLIDACKSKGADVDEVRNAIEATGAAPSMERNYADLSQTELTHHIISTHHSFTRLEIKRLSSLIQKVVSVHGTRHPELVSVQKTFSGLADD